MKAAQRARRQRRREAASSRYTMAMKGDTFEEGWRNKLIWGNNLLVKGSLLEKFAGKIDLVYIDPPFATGADFSVTVQIGESGDEITNRPAPGHPWLDGARRHQA